MLHGTTEGSGNRERETKEAQVSRGIGVDGARNTQNAQIHRIRPTVGREGVGSATGGEHVGSDQQERGWGGVSRPVKATPTEGV